MTLRLAVVQLLVQPGSAHETLERALAAIDRAASEGAEIVLLPEALPLGWMAADTRTAAEPIPDGPWCRAVRDAAVRTGTHVCTGLVERAGEVVYNAAVLVGPGGDVLLHHRKLNELGLACDLYARGDRLGVVETRHGRIGLMICADAFAPGEIVSRTLGLMGAAIILSPCAWAVPPDHDQARTPYGDLWRQCYGVVARDHRLWIAGASSVGPITSGPWTGHACIGCSLIVGPDGEVVAQGPYGVDAEATILVDLDLSLSP
ncbi:carbon-nitrogen hydrolase family protein [Luteitalea sp.]